MNTLGWSEDGEAWNGKRRLLAWEEEQVRECCELLHYFVLQADVADRWLWQLNKSKIYNVYSAYNYLLIIDHKLTTNHTNIIRHKEAPLKFTIFAQRLLQNRLPTSYNLIRRRVLQPNAQLFASGCGIFEDVDHLFLSCEVFRKNQFDIYNQLDLSTINSACVSDHLLQFESLGGLSKTICSVLHLIWLAYVQVIWLERNAQVFQQKRNTIHHLYEKKIRFNLFGG